MFLMTGTFAMNSTSAQLCSPEALVGLFFVHEDMVQTPLRD